MPFFLAVIAYFASSAWKAKGEVWSTIVKCLPIWCLILFVVLTKGVKDLKSRSFFKVRLIFALIFSSLGDLFLNINMFEMGVVAFGVAQIFFISCLGFQPRRFFLGGIIYILWLGMNVFLMHYIPETLEIVFVFIYSGLLVTTCWRGIAACEKVRTVTEFPKLAGAIGGVSFLISDAVLGLSMFVIKESWMSVSVKS